VWQRRNARYVPETLDMDPEPVEEPLDGLEGQRTRGPVIGALDELLGHTKLVTIALAGALAWELVQVAGSVGTIVRALLLDLDDGGGDGSFGPFNPYEGQPLTWRVGNGVLTLGGLVGTLVSLGVVVAVTVFVQRRYGLRKE
jgi:hypothetical protein